LSLETVFDRGADAVANAEGNTATALSRAVRGPRGVGEPEPVCELSMLRTGRSHDHPPIPDGGGAGRTGKAEAVIP